MTLQLPKIYPLTDANLSGLSHSEQVAELISGGSRFIQLREKGATPDKFFAEVLRSVEIAQETDTKIIVNDRVDIALAAKAHGVHLGQDDLPVTAARKLMGDDAIIGISTHNAGQATQAVRLPVDYIAFGPIFSTTTKKDHDPVVGLSQLKQIREIVGDIPLVAIGGINYSTIGETLSCGADSVALISELFNGRATISERFEELTQSTLGVKHL